MILGKFYPKLYHLNIRMEVFMCEELIQIKKRLKKFVSERDWEKYHTPRNLAAALIVEAGELLEHFQWLSEKESENLNDSKKEKIGEEIADVFIYLLLLAEKLNLDIFEITNRKISLNEKKYPAEKVRGSSRKYNEY